MAKHIKNLIEDDPTSGGGLLGRLTDYPDHLRAIGLIVTDFAALETAMSLAMWELLESPVRGTAVFYSINGTQARVATLKALLRDRAPGAVKDEFSVCLDAIDEICANRNRLVHGQWGTPADATRQADPFVQDFRVKARNQYPRYSPTLAQLTAFADEITAWNERLKFIVDIARARRDPGFMSLERKLRGRSADYEARCASFD